MTSNSQIEFEPKAVNLHQLYEQAWLIRAFEQRLLKLFSEGKLQGTVHTCIGQEWTGIAVAEALHEGDVVFSNHRCHGHYLARTGDVDGLMAEVMGKQSGICGGRGGSQHICHGNFFSNGVQGGIVPVAAGMAFGKKIVDAKEIVVAFIGDGTLGEGVVYETMNIASKWQLPLLLVLENNLYAQSTSQSQTLAGDICARAASFDIEAIRANTWDPAALLDVARLAVDSVRGDCRPAFLQIDTYRLMAHSKGDDDRSESEVREHWQRDPLTIFADENQEEARQIQARVAQRIDAAVDRAESDDFPTVGQYQGSAALRAASWESTRIEGNESVVKRIHHALRRGFNEDESAILIGEDIEGPYGGAFKVTKDLSQVHPGRVRNTPISEAAIVGLGTGLALGGLHPICELMFGDFMLLAADQIINHAAKFRYMYNNQVSVPLIIRTPMGGRRGYGATHSQSLEKHFLGVPDTRVLAIHHRFDPATIYERLFKTIDQPVIVIENKLLYGTRATHEAPDGFVWEHTSDPFPTSRLRPFGRADITILCYGGLLTEVENAVDQLFDEHEIICETICPTQLYPLNIEPIVESVRRTRRLIIVEEGQGFAAFGAEALAQTVEAIPGTLQRVRRLAAPSHAIPSCKQLELELLPGQHHIISAAREMMRDE